MNTGLIAKPLAAGELSCRSRMMAALANQPVDRPPLWLMRQAGRYLPEYRAVRQQHTFLEMVHTPELAMEVTTASGANTGQINAVSFSA